MSSLILQRPPSPVYRRPKDDTSVPTCWSMDYGIDDMPSLCDQGTISRNESWLDPSLCLAVDQALDHQVSLISNTDLHEGIFTAVTRLDEDSVQLSPNALKYQSSESEPQPAQSDTEPDAEIEIDAPPVTEEKEDESVNVLELVPKENVVEDIKTVFRYIKQLGSGMEYIFALSLLMCEWEDHVDYMLIRSQL